MENAQSVKIDMGLLMRYDDRLQIRETLNWTSLNIWSTSRIEYQLLRDLVQETHENYPKKDVSITWVESMMNPTGFAKQLRQLDWCAYYWRDAHGLDNISDFNTYLTYGKRWGIVLAPYCSRLTAWRITNL